MYTNLGQIVTTTTTYNPIIDSTQDLDGIVIFILLFFHYAYVHLYIFYSIDKSNIFILINFYNLIISDKSLYYIIQQNLYYVFILLFISLFYYII